MSLITRIVDKFHFIEKLPKKVANPLLKLIIISDDLFWKFRILLTTLIIGKKNKIGKALSELKDTGFAIIPKIYSEKQISKIKEECIRQLDGLPFDKLNTGEYVPNLVLENGLRVEKLEGSIKLKGLHKINLFFKKIGRDFSTNFISLVYHLSSSKPFLVYNVTHDGSFKHPAIPEPCNTKMIAGKTHVDMSLHQLRACLVLDDINKENGPTVLYKNSMNLNLIKQNHLNLFLEQFKFKPNEGGGHFVNENKLKFLEEKVAKIYATAKKGDLILMDLKTPHLASTLGVGQRHLLWYYYH